MDYQKLEQLHKLYKDGALTEEEFKREKEKLYNDSINNESSSKETANNTINNKGALPLNLNESTYLALMNFMLLIPSFGWIFPLILWITGKHNSEKVDSQGKYILNFLITWIIIGFLGSIILGMNILGSFFINNPLSGIYGNTYNNTSLFGAVFGTFGIASVFALAIGLIMLIFPIIGGIKGLNNQTWKYPVSIKFLK